MEDYFNIITLIASPLIAILAYHYGDHLKKRKIIKQSYQTLKLTLNNFQNKLFIENNISIVYNFDDIHVNFVLVNFPISILEEIKRELYLHFKELTQGELYNLFDLANSHNELIKLRNELASNENILNLYTILPSKTINRILELDKRLTEYQTRIIDVSNTCDKLLSEELEMLEKYSFKHIYLWMCFIGIIIFVIVILISLLSKFYFNNSILDMI